jgi:hypothetical protein
VYTPRVSRGWVKFSRSPSIWTMPLFSASSRTVTMCSVSVSVARAINSSVGAERQAAASSALRPSAVRLPSLARTNSARLLGSAVPSAQWSFSMARPSSSA